MRKLFIGLLSFVVVVSGYAQSSDRTFGATWRQMSKEQKEMLIMGTTAGIRMASTYFGYTEAQRRGSSDDNMIELLAVKCAKALTLQMGPTRVVELFNNLYADDRNLVIPFDNAYRYLLRVYGGEKMSEKESEKLLDFIRNDFRSRLSQSSGNSISRK